MLLTPFLLGEVHGEGAPPVGSETPIRHDEARWIQPLQWEHPQIRQAYGLYTSELGLTLHFSLTPWAEEVPIGDRNCIAGSVLGFDVASTVGYDLDEVVWLELTYHRGSTTTPFHVVWESNGGTGMNRSTVSEPGASDDPSGLVTVAIPLDRARMAGNGAAGIDLAVGVEGRGGVTLCDLRIVRSHTTPQPVDSGWVRLQVVDGERGRAVPARVGLFDLSGRAPIPSHDALVLRRHGDRLRLFPVGPQEFWLSEHRQAFYVDGEYRGKVPAGEYEVMVTRGPEYRAVRRSVTVPVEGEVTVVLVLERYADLPAAGWYSGDAHIHLGRHEVADRGVWTQIAAEDVHVANLLEMGNITGFHFAQPAWGAEGQYLVDGHALVSGQENPRTVHRGHTIQHNLAEAVRLDPSEYFLYHRSFEAVREQGGFSGYAHLGPGFSARRGVALDAPFGLVDFLEVLQQGRLTTGIWYDLLDMGYRMTPVAGSDFPYLQLPGAVRYYVKVDGEFSPDAWFEGFRGGEVFVTNGPFLEFSVNGAPMGGTVELERGSTAHVVAEAWMNPDVDELDGLELLIHGEVVAVARASGLDRVRLELSLEMEAGAWLAIRAWGKRDVPTVAHSAPIYVSVGGGPTWNAPRLPHLVETYVAVLDTLLQMPIQGDGDLESWATRELLASEWARQRMVLEPRIREAQARYRTLLTHLHPHQ